jgi:cold shock CspA family protein
MCRTTSTTVSRDSLPKLESLGPALSPEALDRISHPTLDPLDEQVTHNGIVRKIMTEKQYGFIQTEDGSDLFFMLNDVQEPWVVAIGDQVTYHVQKDNTHSGKSRAIRIMPSLLARPSCHSPGGSVLRQTNALRSSMVRMTISAKPKPPAKTTEEWEAEVNFTTETFRKYLIDFAGMDDEEAVEFGEMKIAKAMKADDVSSMPKHLQKIVAARKGLDACNAVAAAANRGIEEMLLDRAEHALRLSAVKEPEHERAIIDPSRTAVANRFNEGDQHAGEVAQIVRGKFGFIIAETTSAAKRVLKQKVFFHLKDAPAGIAVGDRVTFIVQADPYSQEKMIAKDLNITRKAMGTAQHQHLRSNSGSKPQVAPRNNRRRGNGNEAPSSRSSIDGNWRRGRGRDILHTAPAPGGSWSSANGRRA